MALNLSPYQGVFGLPPPTSNLSDEMIRNSMPVMEITPGEPKFSLGLALFRINTKIGWTNFTRILANHGFTVPSKPIKFAFIADNFPTDTFTNEYTETFLQKFTDVASGGLSQIIQMSGQARASEAIDFYGKTFAEAGQAMNKAQEGGMLSKLLTGGGDIMQKGARELKAFQNSGAAGLMGGGLKLVDKMLAGHRIDFPQIWSNSGYTPSYSVTIRLYNPHPRDRNSTLRYIVGPLAVLLCLSIPRSDNGASYRWPFYHRIRVPGLYELNPAVITNLTVVKGGDQQQIAYNQALGMVDVRMDFISLHKSMLLEEQHPSNIDRPTVREYLKEMTEDRGVITRATMNKDNARFAGATEYTPIPGEPDPTPISRAAEERLRLNQAVGIRLPQQTSIGTIEDRVPIDESQIAGTLVLRGNEQGPVYQTVAQASTDVGELG